MTSLKLRLAFALLSSTVLACGASDDAVDSSGADLSQNERPHEEADVQVDGKIDARTGWYKPSNPVKNDDTSFNAGEECAVADNAVFTVEDIDDRTKTATVRLDTATEAGGTECPSGATFHGSSCPPAATAARTRTRQPRSTSSSRKGRW